MTELTSATATVLDPFIKRNPESTVQQQDGAAVIERPWGDRTVQIRVPLESGPLIEALNDVRLPPRFTAIWHADTGDIEFIFAPQPASWDLWKRAFHFRFEGKDLSCEFAPASPRLRLIGPAMRPVEAPTDTLHRNCGSLRTFSRLQSMKPEVAAASTLDLASFWIRGCPFSEDDLPRVARHLNFFTYYFDRLTPRIAVHEGQESKSSAVQAAQLPLGPFPNRIAGRELDPYLVGLWESASTSTEPARKFLYCYQIIEYASFYYLKDEIYQSVKRALTAPDAGARIESVSRQVLDAIVDDRSSDEAKLTAVIQRTVDPAALWAEIAPFADMLSADTVLEGGFVVPALFKKGWTLDDFRAAWTPKLPDTLRRIRNALVHAREQRQSKCIAPTNANQALLVPWATLAMSVALQLMVYGDN